MIAWWARNVAWRLRPASATASPPGPGGAPEGEFCGRCSRPLEDLRFKMCLRCRTMTSFNQATRRKKLVRTALVPNVAGRGTMGILSVRSVWRKSATDTSAARRARDDRPSPSPSPSPTQGQPSRAGDAADPGTIHPCRVAGPAGRPPRSLSVGGLAAWKPGPTVTLVSRATCPTLI